MVDTFTEYMVKVIEVLLKNLFYSVRIHTDWFFHYIGGSKRLGGSMASLLAFGFGSRLHRGQPRGC
jgi:hypothetical protein